MVYTIYLQWNRGWFIIVLQTLYPQIASYIGKLMDVGCRGTLFSDKPIYIYNYIYIQLYTVLYNVGPPPNYVCWCINPKDWWDLLVDSMVDLEGFGAMFTKLAIVLGPQCLYTLLDMIHNRPYPKFCCLHVRFFLLISKLLMLIWLFRMC